jgi:hypothetical protein
MAVKPVSGFKFRVSSELPPETVALETGNLKLETFLVFFRHCTRQVHRGQQNKNVGLQQ